MPVSNTALSSKDYVILPGKLRTYLADGKLPMLRNRASGITLEATKEAREKQKAARNDFTRWVSEGLGRLDKLHYPCGDQCGEALGVLYDMVSMMKSGFEKESDEEDSSTSGGEEWSSSKEEDEWPSSDEEEEYGSDEDN